MNNKIENIIVWIAIISIIFEAISYMITLQYEVAVPWWLCLLLILIAKTEKELRDRTKDLLDISIGNTERCLKLLDMDFPKSNGEV